MSLSWWESRPFCHTLPQVTLPSRVFCFIVFVEGNMLCRATFIWRTDRFGGGLGKQETIFCVVSRGV